MRMALFSIPRALQAANLLQTVLDSHIPHSEKACDLLRVHTQSTYVLFFFRNRKKNEKLPDLLER
jgi:hypothetical protein